MYQHGGTANTYTLSHSMYSALLARDWDLAVSLFDVCLRAGHSYRGRHGEPLMHTLATLGAPPHCIHAILSRYPDGLLEEYDGFTCLHVALLCSAPLETVSTLLHLHPKGPLPSARSKRPGTTLGLTPLCCALLAEPPATLPVVDTLLARHPEGARVECEGLGTPLCLALRRKASVGVVHALLSVYPEAVALPCTSKEAEVTRLHHPVLHPHPVYPLHLACAHNPGAISLIVAQFPYASRLAAYVDTGVPGNGGDGGFGGAPHQQLQQGQGQQYHSNTLSLVSSPGKCTAILRAPSSSSSLSPHARAPLQSWAPSLLSPPPLAYHTYSPAASSSFTTTTFGGNSRVVHSSPPSPRPPRRKKHLPLHILLDNPPTMYTPAAVGSLLTAFPEGIDDEALSLAFYHGAPTEVVTALSQALEAMNPSLGRAGGAGGVWGDDANFPASNVTSPASRKISAPPQLVYFSPPVSNILTLASVSAGQAGVGVGVASGIVPLSPLQPSLNSNSPIQRQQQQQSGTAGQSPSKPLAEEEEKAATTTAATAAAASAATTAITTTASTRPKRNFFLAAAQRILTIVFVVCALVVLWRLWDKFLTLLLGSIDYSTSVGVFEGGSLGLSKGSGSSGSSIGSGSKVKGFL